MPIYALYNEEQLCSRIAAGEEAAFRVLFDRYRQRLYALVLKMVKSPAIAEELVQEVFMNIWEYRRRLKEVRDVDAYIFSIAYHRVFRHLKKAARETQLLENIIRMMEPAGNSTEEHILANESRQLIDRAVHRLPSQRRIIYELSRREGLNHEEIASQLNISRNTVKNQLVQALKYIRTCLQKGALIITLIWLGL